MIGLGACYAEPAAPEAKVSKWEEAQDIAGRIERTHGIEPVANVLIIAAEQGSEGRSRGREGAERGHNVTCECEVLWDT